MCTLAIAWRAFESAPVVVAANRDEVVGRPSEPPSVADGDPAFVAPRDAEAGGTWVGYNERGVFVGVTNRWVDVPGGGERSRGRLVRDCLRADSAADARETVESAVERDAYDGFNLVVADAADALLFEWDGSLSTTRFDPGVHVVVNVGVARARAGSSGGPTASDEAGGGEEGNGETGGDFFEPPARPEAGARQADNARRVREALEPRADDSPEGWRARAASVLGDHEYGVCVHDPEGRFGTRSSSLITLWADGRADYAFAPGPPCETPYESVESQL